MCEVARMRGSRASESTSGVEREPGRRARLAQAAAGELVGEGAQAEVRVRGWHRLRGRARRPRPPPRLHADRRELGGVVRELAGRYRALAPDLGAGAVGGRARPPRGARAAPPSRSPGYSMGGRLALALALRIPERVTRLVLVSASPGIADAGGARRAPRGRRGARRPDRGDRGRGVRARVGGASRCSRASRRRSPPPPTPTASAAARPSTRRSCAASAPASCRRCGTAWAS